MSERTIEERLKKEQYVQLQQRELDSLLSRCDLIREARTPIAGPIRVLQGVGMILVQEESDKKEILVRGFEDEKGVEKFISARMEIYDRMWDGCGCKVDYHSRSEPECE